jgi:putative transcriptional regulator
MQMQPVLHHPSLELLTAYAAASLPLSQALCVSSHLEYCRECRTTLNSLNQLGGQLFVQQRPAPLPTETRQQLLAQINARKNAPAAISTPPRPVAESGVPRCLRQFIQQGLQSLSWKRISLGIRSAELCRDSDDSRVHLLRIKPGSSIATHTHLGDEFTVVLQGSFSDETGLYRQGDFVVRDPRHKHTPVATRDGECICLTVTGAPLKFTGWFFRWLNPLLLRDFKT